MGTKISVGTDGSDASDFAVDWAAMEADRCGDELAVVHVCEIPVAPYGPHGIETAGYQRDVPGSIESGRKLVDAVVSRLGDRYPNVEVVGSAERGEVGPVLTKLTADSRLLVVGAHERHMLTDIILGSNTRFVLHRATTNVAVIPRGMSSEDDRAIRHIVVGVDGSLPSTAALVWAAEEASRWGAALHVVHTWEYPPLDHRSPERVAQDFEHKAGRELSRSIDAFRSARRDLRDIPLETSLVCGPPEDTLISVSKTADMLVVGHKSRSQVSSIVIGSVAFHVAQRAHVPVVVVRRAEM